MYARAPSNASRGDSAFGSSSAAAAERPQDGQNTLISGISAAQCEQIISGLKDNTGLRAFIQIGRWCPEDFAHCPSRAEMKVSRRSQLSTGG